jgi:pimeloyl-ACP methyl ester carboxylesterase
MSAHAVSFLTTHTSVRGVPVRAKVSPQARTACESLVLVHGLGLSHWYMMPTAEQLAEAGVANIYVPDLPGFGDSGHPRHVLDVTGLADALAEWMETVGIVRASLLGNSFACQIIIDLAARYPDRVHRCVLQGPTAPPNERTWFWQFVRWRQNNRYNPRSLGPISYADYHRAGYLRTLRTFQYSLDDRPEDKLPAVRAPTLVVRGRFDPICCALWAEAVTRGLPDGRLVVIPGVAHTLVFTAPEQLAAVTRQFLRPLRVDPVAASPYHPPSAATKDPA